MAEEDARSEVSSELEVQPPPPLGTPTRASIQTLLVARDSPGASPRAKAKAKAQASILDPTATNSQAFPPATNTNLLALHAAVERALLLHLATEGTRTTLTTTTTTTRTTTNPTRDRMRTPEPDEQPSTTLKTFRLANLISWPDLRPIVERGSGKQFTDIELSQLLWLWQSSSSSNDDDDNKFESSSSSSLGFLISNFGLGIELNAIENLILPAFTICSPGNKNSSPDHQTSRKKKNLNGMNVISMWSSQVDARKIEVNKRLNEYLKNCKGKDVPLGKLPLKSSESSSLNRKKKRNRVLDETVVVEESGGGEVKRAKVLEGSTLSTEGRAMSLMERIKAKEEAANLKKREEGGEESLRAELRKKALLSRLPELVESVYMVFVSPTTTTSSSTSRKKKPTMVINELAEVVAKSSRISLSQGEAIESIKLLSNICPDFLKLRVIGKEEWVMMMPTTTSFSSSSELDCTRNQDLDGLLLASTKEKVRKELLR